ncbi:MAG TPA: cytochrome c oxidase assembly protein [Acidimicrobiales bacterium]|nr:cytochrome c oxidase assembly protein [Acidimicrobiales bacterium]
MVISAASGSPWGWHLHPLAWVLVPLLGASHVLARRRLALDAWPRTPTVTGPQQASFLAALVLAFVSLGWPVADLADRSLLAYMVQQCLLLLVIPPLLLLGVPRWLVDLLTRPPGVDAVLRFLFRPMAATVAFNGMAVASFLPVVVNATARSWLVAAGVQLAVLAGGILMWAPALRILPGVGQLTRTGRAGYLIVQSLIPSLASLAFIVARHPLYTALSPRSLGLSPLVDQQLAGALAKVAGVVALLGTAAMMLLRSHQAEGAGRDPDPLRWDDVERELRRLERRERPKDSAS